MMNCSVAWIIAVCCATIACLFIFLYGSLRIRHARICKTLANASEAFAKQSKELESLKKQKAESLDDSEQNQENKSIILSYDQQGVISYANDYALEFFGFKENELIQHNVMGTILPAQKKQYIPQPNIIEKILLNPQLYIDTETKNFKKDGTVVWVSWTNRIIYDENNQPKEIRSVGFDITKRKKLEEKLKYLTSVDPLTGVLNRSAFLEAGDKELKRAIRYNRNLSLLILQLDHFRLMGQEKGYSFGDEALQKTVKICKDSIRDSDYLGRIGDVEFAILLPETSEDNVHYLQERLKLQIQEQNLKTEIGNAFITSDFGTASIQDDKDSIDAMLLRAAQNLKENKQHKGG